MRPGQPTRVLVESEVAGAPLVATLRRNLPDARFEIVDRLEEGASHSPNTLEVVAFRGRMLKTCPGTSHYLCCGYKILHFGAQCTLDCTYCILQAYLNQPNLRLFGNIGDVLSELQMELEANRDVLHRFGTGEFTDSLLLDPFTELTRQLVPFFGRQPNAVLELKTKTDFIRNLRDLDHRGHTVVAWSLNAPAIRKHEEPKTTSIGERLEAARQCAEWGYRLAFHFDPLIEHPDWRAGYAETVDRLFEAIDPDRIVWISLGCLRFMPALKPIIQARHPRSRILSGEFVHGLDGKMRYFRDIRAEMYAFLVDRIRRHAPDCCVYLCMEGRDLWREAFGFSPEERGGLPAMLDEAARLRMGISKDACIKK
jgi:spore photoproduct lyase